MNFSTGTASLKSAAHRLTRLRLGGLTPALLGCVLAAPAEATIYTYDNTTSGATAFVRAKQHCDAATGALNRTFVVSDSFTVANIALGLNVSHNNRGDYRIRLVAPGGTAFNFITQTGDNDNDYDIQMSTNNDGAGVPAIDDNTDRPCRRALFRSPGQHCRRGFLHRQRQRNLDPSGLRSHQQRRQRNFQPRATHSHQHRDGADRLYFDLGLRVGDNGNNNAFTSVTVGGVMTLTADVHARSHLRRGEHRGQHQLHHPDRRLRQPGRLLHDADR